MEHQGSKGTYDFIAKWIASDFFFSSNDKWNRMGILGVFADYVCSCIGGDILEIGCGESSIYLSHVAKKYGRRIYHCDYAPDKIINPSTIEGYFKLGGVYLTAEYKTDDPTIEGRHSPEECPAGEAILFAGPSDRLFKEVKITPLAFAFIDGDHNYAQAKRDFDNIFPLLADHGYVLLHDTYPSCDEELSEHRCGDVYKLRQELEKDPRMETLTLTRGTAMGVGITLVRKKPANRVFYHE